MREVLYIDCCLRGAVSRTRALAESFLAALPADCRLTRLDLAAEPLAPLTAASLAERDALLAEGRAEHPRFRLAHQLAGADIAVIAAPFWDLSVPALLKVYIENVSVEGITFRSTETGLQGLCRGTDLVFLTTRGGIYGPGSDWEQGAPYLNAIQRFFGFGAFHCVAAEGLDVQGFDAAGALKEAGAKAAALAAAL